MKKNNRLSATFSIIVLSILLSACGASRKISRDYLYFRNGADTVAIEQKETTIQPNDLLTIQVYSRTLNQEQAAIFNIPATASNQNQGYQVSMDGNISFPVIGNLKVAGLTKYQLQSILTTKLTDYVKNPTVMVKFQQFNINVLGEVKTPGLQKFQTDRVTIIDAIGSAGDLTDYGTREDVKVIREEDGKRITHTIDLRSRAIFESPVYLLQPNDIVYVSPTRNKLRSLSINPDTQRKTSLLFSIISVSVSIITLAIFSSRN